MAYHGKHLATGGRHPVVRAIAISTALVLVVLAGTVFLTYRHLEGNISVSDGFDDIVVERPDEVEVEGPRRPLNILVLGSDSRAGQKAVLGAAGPGLSDTTILMHLSADRSRAYGVSIPRDLMVSRPACKNAQGERVQGAAVAQWNEAFALAGESCTIAQFERMSDLRVDHFVVVDFNGFKSMVDALDGVPVCVPQEVDDPIGRIYLPAGTYDVTGNQALDYVRVRHSIGTVDTGDIGRMKRQQAFMASMVNKAVSRGTLLNPVRLVRFLDAATKSLTTDEGFSSLTTLASIGNEVRGIGLDRVQFFTVPFTSYEPDPNRLALDPSAKRLWAQLRADKVLAKAFTADAAKASEGEPGTKRGGKGGGKGGSGSGSGSGGAPDAEAAASGLCA